MKNKTLYIILVLLIIIVGGYWIIHANNTSEGVDNTYQPMVGNTQTQTPVPVSATALPGEHCGGNMTTALQCGAGYHCAPNPGSYLPFGDVGGICVGN